MNTHVAGAPAVAQARRNRLVLVCLVLSFLLPFALGHLAYFQGWYRGVNTTNKGALLDPPVALSSLHLRTPASGSADAGRAVDAAWLGKRWQLMYIMPPQCQEACRNSLMQLRQVHKATDTSRVGMLLVQPQAVDAATEALLDQQTQGLVRVTGTAATLDQALAGAAPGAAGAGRLYIMDPRGFIMLSYAPETDARRSVLAAQDMLDDLKKLLDVSQIG